MKRLTLTLGLLVLGAGTVACSSSGAAPATSSGPVDPNAPVVVAQNNAYDAATGKTLWTHQTGVNVGAPPMSYAVNGRQYVAVATGSAPGPGGPGQPGAIRVFALPQPQ